MYDCPDGSDEYDCGKYFIAKPLWIILADIDDS